jgi:hypothetical protein
MRDCTDKQKNFGAAELKQVIGGKHKRATNVKMLK